MSKTSIEWTGHTWNPLAGCSLKSPGCSRCYAMKMARRIELMGTAPHYAGLTQVVNGTAVWTGKIVQASDEMLLAPLRRKKPTTYFVNSMSDLFHEDVPDEWIDRIFAVMALAPQHTFQVLTKRAERMHSYFTKRRFLDVHPLEVRADAISDAMNDLAPSDWSKRELTDYCQEGLPLRNVWLGVSTEDQKRADERIPLLLRTPAVVRFISAEPLLGPIHLGYLGWPSGEVSARTGHNALLGARYHNGSLVERLPSLDWVIVGGESGADARPMHPNWARSLREQCAAAAIPFFFKQWGEYVSVSEVEGPGEHHRFSDGATVRRTGKRRAGRTLDGALHQAMPACHQHSTSMDHSRGGS